MQDLHLLTPAKINLGLRLGRRLANGYHQVNTVMYRLPLTDTLEVHWLPAGERNQLICHQAAVPDSDDNLILRLLTRLQADYDLPPALIRLDKRIPVGAGLAGGSSNAGCLLGALAGPAYLGLSRTQLRQRALDLGADVPFFASSAPGTYEQQHGLPSLQTQELPALPRCQIVLVYQNFALDTVAMYTTYDQLVTPDKQTAPAPLDALVTACQQQSLSAIGAQLSNDFEPVLARQHPEVLAVKQALLAAGAVGAGLTGKGPTVFGLFAPDQPIKLDIASPYEIWQLESQDA